MRLIALPQKVYNSEKLKQEMRQQVGEVFLGMLGHPDDPTQYDGVVDDTAPASVDTLVESIAQAHDPALTPEQDAILREQTALESAKVNARNIPNWAGWSQADFQAWYDANISATQINAITSLAEARPILVKQSAAIEALGKMVIAMRNQLWPDLQD